MAPVIESGGRVLFVSYDGLLEPLGSAQILPYVKGLADVGFGIDVLSFEKPGDVREQERVRAIAEDLAGRGIGWKWLRYHRRPRFPATTADVVRGAGEVRRLRPRLIHARSYIPTLMGELGRRNGDAKLLFDMRGFWVDERVEAQGWSADSLLTRLGRRVERGLLDRSDHIVVLTGVAHQHLRAMGGGPPSEALSVIPTSADLGRFSVPEDPSVARAALGIPAAGPVLVHSGTLGVRYQRDRTLRVGAAFVKATGGTFLILTSEKDEVTAAAVSAGVPAIVDTVPYADMPAALAAADAGIALMKPRPSTLASAPTKVGEYLATGLAVAATDCGDLGQHFCGARASFVVGNDVAPDAIALRLAEAAGWAGRRRESRTLAERHYSLESAVERYAAAYERLGVRPCA